MKTESVIDFPKETLCPEIWEKVVDQNGMNEVWKLIPEVKAKMMNFIQKLVDLAKLQFPNEVHITGSITSNSYTENADIDIHILKYTISEPVKMTQSRFVEALKTLREADKESTYIGTHPFEVYYQENEFQDYMSVGCYDFLKDEWLVGPELIDQSFNPYSEYYEEVQEKSESIANNIRNTIFSIYEIAVVLKKNISTDFGNNIRQVFVSKLEEAKALYENIRQMRKVYSSPESIEQALQYRSSRKWKIADAAFKLFDKYGYMAILKQFVESYDLIQNTQDIDIEVIENILSTVKQYINNADKLSEQEIYENTQIDEDLKSAAAQFALSLSLLIPGIASADTIRVAKNKAGETIQTIYNKENIFKQLLKDQNPNAQFGKFKFWQACNILSLTLFGEGRSEIQNGGIDLICDSILNRTASNSPDLKRIADICIGRKAGKAFQYSFWNDNKTALSIMTNQLDAVVPTSIANALEKKAWEFCIQRAIEILTNNYVITDKTINSYYVTDMKNPPTWAKQLTNKKTRGVHTFGYLVSNDPRYTNMATMTPVKKPNNIVKQTKTVPAKTYVVKKGDTLWKIAKANMTTAKQLMLKNNISDPSRIQIGQKLKI